MTSNQHLPQCLVETTKRLGGSSNDVLMTMWSQEHSRLRRFGDGDSFLSDNEGVTANIREQGALFGMCVRIYVSRVLYSGCVCSLVNKYCLLSLECAKQTFVKRR